jgi:hypothetical protein
LKGVQPKVAAEVVEHVLVEEGVSPADLSIKAAAGWIQKQSSRTRTELLGDRFSPEREKIRRRLYGFLSRRGFRGDAVRRGMEAGEEKAREIEG